MFRKVVSTLPFSPAYVGQLGHYIGKIEKERFIRRLGFIFTIAALLIQAFTVFNPPEQALASNAGDVIPGGISSLQQILNVYDTGNNGFKELLQYVGITRDELVNLNKKNSRLCSKDAIADFNRQPLFSTNEGELVHEVFTRQGSMLFYSRPLALHDRVQHTNSCYRAFVGRSAKVGWFSIVTTNGDLQIRQGALPTPHAHFTNVTCRNVQGYAYDEHDLGKSVKVYLFIGGPPGAGKPYGPIIANQASPNSPSGHNHGFIFALPDNTAGTQIWGAMQPLSGWKEPYPQFDRAANIPSVCNLPPQPTVVCENLTISIIERTKFKLTAATQAQQGATIQAYDYIVSDATGNVVIDKKYDSNALDFSSEPITLAKEGTYNAKVVVKSTIGDRVAPQCAKQIHVSLANCPYNTTLTTTDSGCKACPYDSGLWIQDIDCVSKVVLSKQVGNLTKLVDDANNTTAKPDDRLEYTLYTTNLGGTVATQNVQENLADILIYSSLIDNAGANFNDTSKLLSWGDTRLTPGQMDVRRLIVQVNSKIAITPRGANDLSAYNCAMTNSYGNTTSVKVDCPLQKKVEGMIQNLPTTSPEANIAFGVTWLLIVYYLYARSRLLRKESRIIRNLYNQGGM